MKEFYMIYFICLYYNIFITCIYCICMEYKEGIIYYENENEEGNGSINGNGHGN